MGVCNLSGLIDMVLPSESRERNMGTKGLPTMFSHTFKDRPSTYDRTQTLCIFKI